MSDPTNYFYAIGSAVGPHPFPKMVRDFQSIVGTEAREQFLAKHKRFAFFFRFYYVLDLLGWVWTGLGLGLGLVSVFHSL